MLPYAPEKSGLYLHGLNDSSSVFKTQPPEKVNEFAREWGFFETPFHTEQTVQKTLEFVEPIIKSGRWKGDSIEGFVVRCSIKDDPKLLSTNDDAPPCLSGSPFFFKVNCEPCKLYRGWREITKALLRNVHLPLSAMQQPGSLLYLQWAQKEIQRDPQQFERYCANKGIFAARQKFLDWRESGDCAIDSLKESIESMRISLTERRTGTVGRVHHLHNSYRNHHSPKTSLVTPDQYRYYGFDLPDLDLKQLIESTLGPSSSSEPEEFPELNASITQDQESQHRDTVCRFWSMLLAKGRVKPRPHVTIVHVSALKSKDDNDIALWDACTSLCVPPSRFSNSFLLGTGIIQQPEWLIKPNSIICDDKVMAIAVDLTYAASTNPRQSEQADGFLSMLPQNLRSRLHITVGTQDVTVHPVEAKELTNRWRRSRETNLKGIAVVPMSGITLKGKMAGFL